MKTRGLIGHVEVSLFVFCLIVFYGSPSGAANYDIQCEEHDGRISLFVIDTINRTVTHSYPINNSGIFQQNYEFVSDDGRDVVLHASPTLGLLTFRDRINMKTGKWFRSLDDSLIPGWAYIGQCWNR